MYRLLLLDIDGTLRPQGHSRIPAENVAAVQAVQAGNDLLCCADYEASAAAITQAVERGEIPLEQIDDSVLRILKWKHELGLT